LEKTINIFTGCGDGEVMIHWCLLSQTPCRTVLGWGCVTTDLHTPVSPLFRGEL